GVPMHRVRSLKSPYPLRTPVTARNPDLLILEYDAARTERFLAVARRLRLTPRVWRAAADMLADLEPFLPHACLIALDNDPDPEWPANAPDPGEGIDVARWLGGRPPVCPVIVHTSNSARGHAMVGELELAGWTVRRVGPVGDDWIELDWRLAARDLIRATNS
ncbi:MAG: hypothetical protein ACRC7O_15900, partial [Fimbriiglobus sp.]